MRKILEERTGAWTTARLNGKEERPDQQNEWETNGQVARAEVTGQFYTHTRVRHTLQRLNLAHSSHFLFNNEHEKNMRKEKDLTSMI